MPEVKKIDGVERELYTLEELIEASGMTRSGVRAILNKKLILPVSKAGKKFLYSKYAYDHMVSKKAADLANPTRKLTTSMKLKEYEERISHLEESVKILESQLAEILDQ